MRVLRVLNGRLAGSEKAAPQTGSLSIGPQYWQNVVIRTPETEGTALDLEFDESEVARLTVRGIDAGKAVVYAPPIWAPIMFVVRNLPRFVFNRLNI